MIKKILSSLSHLTLWIIYWFLDRSKLSWRQELSRLGSRDNKWVWIILCIVIAIFLLPYLTKEAFTISLLLGMSFAWSVFLAVSFGYILRNPLLLILVYVGVVMGKEVTKLFITAKDVAFNGDIIGATILICLGIYLIVWVNRIKRGEVE